MNKQMNEQTKNEQMNLIQLKKLVKLYLLQKRLVLRMH